MARKSALKRTLVTFFIALVTYALFSSFFNPTTVTHSSIKLDDTAFFLNLAKTASVFHLDSNHFGRNPLVKVYVHDLPPRFTYGVIKQHSLARGGRPVDDVTTLKYPSHQQMSEWYLYSDLMRPHPSVLVHLLLGYRIPRRRTYSLCRSSLL